MKSTHFYTLSLNVELKGESYPAMELSFENKTDIYDIILYRKHDGELKEQWRKNSKNVNGIEIGILAKIIPVYETLKPAFEAYLAPLDEVLFEGDTLSKNDLWWKIKEKVDDINAPKPKTTKNSTVKP